MGHLLIKNLILVPAFMMLILALLISYSMTVGRMVSIYILQACILSGITVLTGLEIFTDPARNAGVGAVVLYVALGMLPLVLATIIRPLLARATLPQDDPWIAGVVRLHRRRSLIAEAKPVWLEHGRARGSAVTNISINLGLTVLSFFIAYRLAQGQTARQRPPQDPLDSINLAISLGLVLIGLFVLIVKTDIISQIIGLLIMEHGLFLAAIKVVKIQALGLIFVISMFFYILVTLLILVILLPALRKQAESIEIDEMSELRG